MIVSYNISDRDYGLDVFLDDCDTPSSAIPVSDSVTLVDGDYKSVDFSLALDQGELQNASMWEPMPNGGNLTFCTKMILYLDEEKTINAVFLAVLYTISVDTTTDFTMYIDLERTASGEDDIVSFEIDLSLSLTAYHCDRDTREQLIDADPLYQGNVLSICVTSISDEYKVYGIGELSLSQDAYGTSLTGVTFTAIEERDVTSTLVETGCTDDDVCFVDIVLISDFFREPNPPDIKVEGSGLMTSLGDTPERRLGDISTISTHRKLAVEGKGSFDLSISLGSDTGGALDVAANEDSSASQKMTGRLVMLLSYFSFFVLR